MKNLLLNALFVAALLPGAAPAADPLPAKIRLVVPFAPTGPSDYSARVLAESLKDVLKRPVIVDNRPGANGVVAASALKAAPLDGETLLFASSGMLTVAQHYEKSLPYDPIKDFEPISTVTYVDAVFVVRGDVPANNFKSFLDYARNKKPPVSLAHSGPGTVLQGYLDMLRDASGIDFLQVPYKGAGPAFADVLGWQVDGMFVIFGLSLKHIESGKLKAFGVVGTKRSPLAPHIPTLEEQGYPGFPVSWNGVLALKGTSPDTIKALAGGIAKALEDENVKAKLLNAGIPTMVVAGAEFRDLIQAESNRWKKLLKK